MIEPTPEVIDAWELVVSRDGVAERAMAGRTSGYYNMEGLAASMSPEAQKGRQGRCLGAETWLI